ncbi:DNA-3-methyladenine glycosylase [Clostridium sp. SHJSY1]|uniref:DNA-3-methyladenine glycosylase n=1 Tax=Clostridium sp. SHJSY1 TaxID=2942483 RepID=UPI002874A1A6|nr:DNA-3-methyladenine glycosylase [Clostridium sp. SHJSY1]MDS0527365.1 DNA-3-methyladenine glycosylase [Clostridium sp. SHJSY1]
MRVLKEEFYGRKTLLVAEELLGKYLIHKVDGKYIGGKIVETEGYLGVNDKGAHVYGGKKTDRVMPLYGQEGTAYIYQIYGLYYCLNAITEKKGEPQGVLIRAIEPLFGLDFMSQRRTKKNYNELSKKEIRNLTSGPSKLCLALDIDKRLNNILLWDKELFIVDKDEEIKKLLEREEDKTGDVVKSKRIGIEYAEEAKDFLYRFYYIDNGFVSKKDKIIK